jgi:hypothetical protein
MTAESPSPRQERHSQSYLTGYIGKLDGIHKDQQQVYKINISQ